MNTTMPTDPQFNNYYRKHLKLLKLGGMQPKTIEAYSRAIRRIGNYFDCRNNRATIGDRPRLTESQQVYCMISTDYTVKNVVCPLFCSHRVSQPADHGRHQLA